MKNFKLETLKTWALIALIFTILGFVAGWTERSHLQIVHAAANTSATTSATPSK